MIKKIQLFLIYLLIFSTICVDLRLSGKSLVYAPGDLGLGLPRLTEFLSILFICVSFLKLKLTKRIHILILFSIALMSLFAMYKPFYSNYLRVAILLPMLLLLCLTQIKINKDQFLNLLYALFYSASISSFFVLISTHFDLGVSHFYADIDVERYVGFGQSLPYQACYSLMSIPLFVFLQKMTIHKFINIINIVCIFINIMAIFLTGARTAYIILALLFLLYYKTMIKNIKAWHFIVIGIIIIYLVGLYYDTIIGVLFARNKIELAGRDEVWLISIQLILSNPIFGISDYFEEGKQFGNVLAHSQNGFFEILFWGGIGGFVLLMSVYLKIYNSYKGVYVLKQLCQGVFLVFVFFMMTEILFFSVQAYFQFILIGGLVYAYSRSIVCCNSKK